MATLTLDKPVTVPARADASLTAAFDRFRQGGHLPNLDGLRGLAILLVILHHAPYVGCLSTLHANGRYGVSMFFLISGFLIATLFLREERSMGRIDLPRFYARRTLRLLPLYYVVLGLYVLLVCGAGVYSAANRALFLDKLPGYLFYFSNLHPRATEGPFAFAWSLAVEEQFYLVFGLLIVLVPRRGLMALVATALISKLVICNTAGALTPATISVLRLVHEPILWGVLLAWLVDRRAGFALFHRVVGHPAVLVVAAAWCLGQLAWLEMHDKSGLPAQWWYLSVALLVGGAALGRPLPILSNRLVAHVGVVSYGIYLTHMLVINTLKRVISDPRLLLLTAIPATILLATLIYRYFERPILRHKKRLQPVAAAG